MHTFECPQVIVKQAEEQMRRGEINLSQYNQLLTTVVTLVEQDKIREAQYRDRRHHRTPSHFPGMAFYFISKRLIESQLINGFTITVNRYVSCPAY